MFLKVCGITRLTDARHAVEKGATALGFVFWPASPRHVTAEQAREIVAAVPSSVTTIGVFVNESIERIRNTVATAGVSAVQLHGDEPPAYAEALPCPVFRSVTVDTAGAAIEAWGPGTMLLLDAWDPARRGGTGRSVDWERAAALSRRRRLVLAGGLDPLNVAAAIERVRPYGVDVSSGVEEAPGVKDFKKVTEFLANARRAFEAS